MKQLGKTQNMIFILGGLLMVIGAGCFAFMWNQRIVCWVFLAGSVMFSTMQAAQLYEGSNFNIRRLKRIQNIADLFFVLAGVLMIDSAYHILLPLFRNSSGTGYQNYIQYVYNKWVLLLIIAAILEIYTTHRIDSELKKENNRLPDDKQ